MDTQRRFLVGAGLAAVVALAISCSESTSPPAVATVVVSPASVTIVAGTNTQLTADVFDSDDRPITGRTLTWATADPGIVSVSPAGSVTGLAPGHATVTATAEGKSGPAIVDVIPVPVATVTMQPSSLLLEVGTVQTLSTILRDANGNTITGRTVSWSSSVPGIASVTQAGVVTANAPGQAVVTATSEGKSGTAIVDVIPAPVATVTVQPAVLALAVGATQTLTVVLRDANGNTLTGRTVSWSSSVPGIASVTQTGVVTANAPGQAVVTATSEGISGSAVVTVGVPGADFSIEGAQFTQATQATDGSIPMVLGGNGAAVNVLMSSNAAAVTSMQVVLRLFNLAGALVRSDTLLVNVAPGAAPTYLTPTAQFLLPPAALVAGIRWQVVRDPKGLVPDGNAATDVFPRQGPVALAMVTVPTLKVRFIPIVLTAHNNTTGNVNAGNLAEYTRTLESIHPLAAIQASVGTPFATPQSFGTPPQNGGDATTFWQPILIQLDQARLLDPDPTTYWVGVVLPPAGFTLTLNGGIGYVPGSGASSGAGTRTSMVTSFGWAANPAFTRETVAHELGHNFGRFHSPCGPAGNPDPAYPYGGGVIGVPGHDVRGWMAGRSAVAIAMAPTFGDIMGYCNQNWISDYTYRAVLSFRGSTAAARGAEAIVKAQAATRVVMVSGSVREGSEVSIEPAFTLDARPARPEAGGPYHLEGRATDGRTLFAYDFTPSVIDHVPNTRHFAFALPVTPDVEAALASIDVRGPAGVARLGRPTALPALRAPASLAPQRVAGGLVSVACADANARGILVRDATTGALLGMATASTARVVAGAGTPLTVVCSDGVQSTRTAVIAR